MKSISVSTTPKAATNPALSHSRKFACFAGTLLALLLTPAVSANIAANVQRTEVNGLAVYAYKTSIEDVVILQGWLPAGDCFSPAGNPAIATLTAGMLDKGTTKQGKFALAKQLEERAAPISFEASSQVLKFSARCLKEDLPVVITLLAEQLRTPAFDPAEFSKYQQQLTGSLQRSLENTGTQASIAFSRAIFPPGHPNRSPSLEEFIAGVAAAKVDDLKAFHAAHYGPVHLTLVAVGDVDLAQLQTELGQAFAGWTGGSPLPVVQPAVAATLPDAERDQTVFIPGKTSVNVALGQATRMRYSDPDALALRAATAVFGTGFTGRLMANVRDKEGLTYGVYAGVDEDTFADGDWAVTGTFAPALLDKGIVSICRQLDHWHRDGVTAAELAAKKENMIGGFHVGLSTTAGLAGAIAVTLQRGLALDWLDRFPDAVNALTLERVNAVIQRRLDPAQMVLIKAGTVTAPTP